MSFQVMVIEGSGSCVTFIKGSARLDIHRPHPQKEALRYRIKLVREFINKIKEQNNVKL